MKTAETISTAAETKSRGRKPCNQRTCHLTARTIGTTKTQSIPLLSGRGRSPPVKPAQGIGNGRSTYVPFAPIWKANRRCNGRNNSSQSCTRDGRGQDLLLELPDGQSGMVSPGSTVCDSSGTRVQDRKSTLLN